VDAEQELAAFIGATFRSVWALEVLCHLREQPGEARSPEQLVASLRASDLVVRTSLAELMAAGLVSIDRDGQASYAPATDRLARLAGAAEVRYSRSPDAVRRIIVRAASPGLTAFSDAFRLGGDK
jgi:DNA-binding GntR family transcriptional regulator